MSLAVRVTDRGVGLALRRMSALLSDMTPVHEAVGSRLERNINLRFDTQTGPDGSAWKQWAPSTAKARAAEGRGTLLQYTGRMRASLTHLADNDGVEVGFGVGYAVFAEFMGRPLLFDDGQLSDEDSNDALKAALQAFRKQLRLQAQ
jgi:phage gpG-like protein